ncbi:hypothetical protein [Thermomonas carbonis]|uniref:Heavy-metal-associated domain-containing protein n=1 Tax=Thermomonas carbonis TaxID=1463158 RepID=A0A7G9SQF9_9GAMM|nr:hypothetical protein [Thermomonas carbonis]QNN70084.1 hypothetical protein H9L16_00010 [Thermomonas carbonis]GHB97650.1 hypothetical protein GCM10010080_07270 [Thermomonas carbonis]
MQYILENGSPRDLGAIERALATLDPSALVDVDPSGGSMRISTVATERELLATLSDAGIADPAPHLARVPSDCCGGCGG